jgi:porin
MPFTFTGALTVDTLANVSGGRKKGLAALDLLKISAAFDGGAVGRPGWSGLVSVVQIGAGDFTGARVGGFQAITNTEARPGGVRLYEAWVQHAFANGAAGVKFGFIDFNTTFDVQETAALFLNASHGIGPDISDTGRNGPSIYPIPALAVSGVYRPAEGWTAQLGVFDAVAGDPAHRSRFAAVQLSAADGALVVAQVEKRLGDAARLEAGAWGYTGKFPALDTLPPSVTSRRLGGVGGVYGLAEGRLLGPPGGRDLSGWVRLGLANGRVNPAQSYLGSGLVYTGAIPGRERDELGVAVARVGFGSSARVAGLRLGESIGGSETDVEATYRLAFRDWLNIQPDVQYVIQPNGDRRRRPAVVVGLRLAFTATR